MYTNVKSRVLHSSSNTLSETFLCNCGVRQGENLSPVLFSLFLNDLEAYLESKGHYGVELTDIDGYIQYIQIMLLLYADDTILISESNISLQNTLDDFVDYCNTWKLNINEEKTKVIVFGSRSKQFTFTLGNSELEIVDSYKYLGTCFSKSGSFLAMRKQVASQAKRALYLLYKRIYNLHLPFDLSLKLFDHTIIPILTYASEIWGYEDLSIIENIHRDFLRTIFKLRKSTPLYMLYAETGRYPLSIVVKFRAIGFWLNMITGDTNKLSYKVYRYMLNIPNFKSKWLTFVRQIIEETGKLDAWQNQTSLQNTSLKHEIKQVLIDQNLQHWQSILDQSTKARNYSIFKQSIQLEKYALQLNKYNAIVLCKFRTGNHFLPVETGRWEGIAISDRTCALCENVNEIADEYHYILICPFFNEQRKTFLKKYFYTRPNTLKFLRPLPNC